MRKYLLCAALSLSCILPLAAQEGPLRDAMALAREGKYDQAIERIQEVMRRNPAEDREARMSLGLVYFKAGRNDSALEQFAKVLEAKKDSPMAYYFTGLIYEKKALGESDRAAAKEMKRRALDAWQGYLGCAGRTPRPESHCRIGIPAEESMKRARHHVELLREELGNE